MSKFKVNNSYSLGHASNAELLRAAQAKGIIGVSNSAPMITTPNIQATFGALTYIRPKAVEILTAPMMADSISTSQKNGNWGDMAVNIKVKEFRPKTVPDDGHANGNIKSTVNYTNVIRGVYYMQSGWNVTDLEEARVGAIQENVRADKVNSAMLALNLDFNNIFFSGIVEKGVVSPIYGYLNDPNLLPYQTVTGGVWFSKTPQDIYNDIVKAVTTLNQQSGGRVLNSGGGKLQLEVAVGSIGQLDRSNEYRVTARSLLKENYPNMEIIGIPQFNSADSNSDVFYVEYIDPIGETVLNSYVERARAYPIFVEDSETRQKISGSTSGCVVQYPMFISRWNGIGKSASI